MAKNKFDNLESKMLFKLPPEKAVEYMQKKGYQITNDWREMWEEAHAKAFTISKMSDAQLLKESKEIIDKAISEGWSSKKAEKELTNLYQKKGWWGKKIITDKNDEEKEIQLGSPRRVRTIFRTNLQSAYAAQRYLTQLEDVDFAPYFQYIAILDNRTRATHRAMHEKVFRYDDPIWSTMYPPNGWGCRCMVRSLTESDVKRMELKVETSDNKMTTKNVIINNDTGETKEVSTFRTSDLAGNVLTMETDAGWNYNIGSSAWNLDVMAYKEIAQLPQNIQDKFISEMAQNPHRKELIVSLIEKMLKKDYKNAVIDIPITWLTPKIIKTLKNNHIETVSPIISFERKQVHHSLNPNIKVAKQRLTEPQFKNIYEYLNNPDEIFIDTEKKQLLFVKFLPKKEVIEDRDCIKIPVIINSNNKNRPINYIGTTGRVNYNETFKNPYYKKIE